MSARRYRLLDVVEAVAEAGHASVDEVRSDSRVAPLPELRGAVVLLARERGYDAATIAGLLHRREVGPRAAEALLRAESRLRVRLARGDVDVLRVVSRAREALRARSPARA